MKVCEISVFLAYISFIYILASIIYLVVSQSFGTPFKDALQKYPELMKIKKQSAEKRKNLFFSGIFASTIIMYVFKPFGSCW